MQFVINPASIACQLFKQETSNKNQSDGGTARAQLTAASEHRCSFLYEHRAETKHGELHLHEQLNLCLLP